MKRTFLSTALVAALGLSAGTAQAASFTYQLRHSTDSVLGAQRRQRDRWSAGHVQGSGSWR